ncbi:MAG TPA: hypothetical protein VHL53_20765 [Acidimicrobiia bacterium]|nr:hypothetical protein [Acidimicrobiia bacterium]
MDSEGTGQLLLGEALERVKAAHARSGLERVQEISPTWTPTA